MIPSNATSILKSLISTKLNPLFSKLNGLFFPRKTPEAKKPIPADSETADFIKRHGESIKELEAMAMELKKSFQRNDLKQEQGLNNSVPTNQATESSGESEKSSGGNNKYPARTHLSPVLEERSLDLSPEKITHEHVPTRIATSQKLTSGKSLKIDYGGYQPDDPMLIRAQESLGVEDPDKRTKRREVSLKLAPQSSLQTAPQSRWETLRPTSAELRMNRSLIYSDPQQDIEKITRQLKGLIKSEINNGYQEEGVKKYLSGLAKVNPIRTKICEQIFEEIFSKELKISNNYEAVISPAIKSDSSDIDKAFNQLDKSYKQLLNLYSNHSGVKYGIEAFAVVPRSSLEETSDKSVVPKSSLHNKTNNGDRDESPVNTSAQKVSPDPQQNHHP